MDLPMIPIIAFAVSAMVLLGAGGMMARRRPSAPAVIPAEGHAKMLPLMDAATMMQSAAQRERMVIATVAEKDAAGAAQWFAGSIASVVPVYRRDGAGAYRKLEAGQEIGSGTADLYIRKRDYPAYLRWARSVQ